MKKYKRITDVFMHPYGHDTVEEFIRRSYDDTLQEFRSGNVPLKTRGGGISRLFR